MSDAVLVAVIGACAVVMSSALAIVVAKINRSVKIIRGDQVAIRDQLENDHVGNPSKVANFREDFDAKHDAVIGVVRDEFADLRREVGADIGGIRSDLRITRREIAATNERIDETNKHVNRVSLRLEARKEPA